MRPASGLLDKQTPAAGAGKYPAEPDASGPPKRERRPKKRVQRFVAPQEQ